MQSLPQTQDLVLIGGGHTHALVLKRWSMQTLPGARLTVIDPGPTAAYSGMLPGFVAGHYDRDDLNIDLVRLARAAGARLILGAANGIDLVAKTVTVPGRPPVAFDVASVDVGITSAMPDLPGFAEWGIPAKPLTPFASRWSAFRAASSSNPQVAVIGGGVAGAELAMAMAHALRGRGGAVRLVDRGQALAAMTPTGRRLVMQSLAALGVEVIENATVDRVGTDRLELSDGREILSDFTTGAAGARPHDWIATTGLALKDGFIAIDENLRSSDPAIFASGDCSHMTSSPRPKAGVFAVRQAPVLFDNLRAVLSGGTPRPFRAQTDYLKLVSLGDQTALAEKWGTAGKGRLLWRWKDRIDRSFMDKFRTLAPMTQPEVPLTAALGLREAVGDHPPCAGCGGKVGRATLMSGLVLITATRADVDRLSGDDAAILRTGGVRQVITTDHLRAVTADPVLMTRIAAIHALGDIWAMGATPQAATVSLVLPRLSADLQARTLAEIMATADKVMAEAGAAIAGGHTSLGDELTIGFTLTGLCDRDPLTLAGGKPGDVLVLTKPIGSGVILAAEMRGLASGEVVAACHDAMIVPQSPASAILSVAHAMTDVTGFGLAGHLAGMCAASGVGATLDLDRIPLLTGAKALAVAGVRSTLWQDNRSGSGTIFGAAGPVGDLLFDPQTCGGLLAAVPQDQAGTILDGLQTAGYAAAIIGALTAGDTIITCR
jgi:selenide, water dikinase